MPRPSGLVLALLCGCGSPATTSGFGPGGPGGGDEADTSTGVAGSSTSSSSTGAGEASTTSAPRGPVLLEVDRGLRRIDLEALDGADPWHACARTMLRDVTGRAQVDVYL